MTVSVIREFSVNSGENPEYNRGFCETCKIRGCVLLWPCATFKGRNPEHPGAGHRERVKSLMEQGLIQVYSGEGHGKSAAALGKAMQIAGTGKSVVIINFLKGNQNEEYLKRLEPEIKIFRFEKSEEEFAQLSEERKLEEIHNIKNGLNFAKKVLTTGECSLLILDEVLGLIDNGIITIDDLRHILEAKAEDVGIILTGIYLNDEVCQIADEIFRIEVVNYKIFEGK